MAYANRDEPDQPGIHVCDVMTFEDPNQMNKFSDALKSRPARSGPSVFAHIVGYFNSINNKSPNPDPGPRQCLGDAHTGKNFAIHHFSCGFW